MFIALKETMAKQTKGGVMTMSVSPGLYLDWTWICLDIAFILFSKNKVCFSLWNRSVKNYWLKTVHSRWWFSVHKWCYFNSINEIKVNNSEHHKHAWSICMRLVCVSCSVMSDSFVAHQAPLCVEFSRQERYSGLPFLFQCMCIH